jgi:quercetin dioxygenase-like cupin family protein
MPSVPNVTTNVLLRSEETGGQVSVTEIAVPPHSAGPPLHTHDFDEAFYMLEGELIFQVEHGLATKGAGELSFAPRNVPHTLANHGDAPARYLLVCTPAVRAPLGAHRRRRGRSRAAAVGAAADPRGHGRRPADRSMIGSRLGAVSDALAPDERRVRSPRTSGECARPSPPGARIRMIATLSVAARLMRWDPRALLAGIVGYG